MAESVGPAPAQPGAVRLNLWRPIPARPADFFSPEELEKARSYQRPAQRVALAGTILSAGVGVALVLLHLGPALQSALHVPWPAQLAVIGVATVVIEAVMQLPLSTWREFGHERRWGFSRQMPGRYATDWLKGVGVTALLTIVITVPLWALIRWTAAWWVLGAGVVAIVGVLAALALPILFVRLFNKVTSLEDPVLVERLQSLAEKAAVSISDYKVIDASKRTTKDNAFFAGLGRTRRVILYDNILARTPGEIGVVVAHEIGHWRRRHLRYQLAFLICVSIAEFGVIALIASWQPLLALAGVASLKEPAAWPLFSLLLGAGFGVVGLARAWIARVQERQADVDALELSRDAESYVQLWRTLATKDLPDLDPSWWHRLRGDHPPIAERMRLAELWSQAQA